MNNTEKIMEEVSRIIDNTSDEVIRHFVKKAAHQGIDSEIEFLEQMAKFYETEQTKTLLDKPEDTSTLIYLATREAVVLNKLREARERKTLIMLKSLQRDVKDIENSLRESGLIK